MVSVSAQIQPQKSGDTPKMEPTPNAGREAGHPSLSPVIQEALKWQGAVTYLMGGNDLRPGGRIDAAHFVTTVFRRAGVPIPDPPVRNQEKYGEIVYWRGQREEFGRVYNRSIGKPEDLRPGDRIIFQENPTNSNVRGNYHTGIYIGPYHDPVKNVTYMHAFIHSGSFHNGVGIDDLFKGYLRKKPMYVVRGNTLRRHP